MKRMTLSWVTWETEVPFTKIRDKGCENTFRDHDEFRLALVSWRCLQVIWGETARDKHVIVNLLYPVSLH